MNDIGLIPEITIEEARVHLEAHAFNLRMNGDGIKAHAIAVCLRAIEARGEVNGEPNIYNAPNSADGVRILRGRIFVIVEKLGLRNPTLAGVEWAIERMHRENGHAYAFALGEIRRVLGMESGGILAILDEIRRLKAKADGL